jgi:hypothetical protein
VQAWGALGDQEQVIAHRPARRGFLVTPPKQSQSASSPAAKKESTAERTENTEKSNSARASRDYKVTVPCLLAHSLCMQLFSVTSVVPQARDEILLGLLRLRASLSRPR